MKLSAKVRFEVISQAQAILPDKKCAISILDNLIKDLNIKIYKKKINDITIIKNLVDSSLCMKQIHAAIITADYNSSIDDIVEEYYRDVLINLILTVTAKVKLGKYKWLIPDGVILPLSMNKTINDILGQPLSVDEETYMMKPLKSLSYILIEDENDDNNSPCLSCLSKNCPYEEKVEIKIDNRIFYLPKGKKIQVRPNGVDFVCHGDGLCGKCKVLTKGALPANATEQANLTIEEIENGYRLLCQMVAVKDLQITTLKTNDFKILTQYDNTTWRIDHIPYSGYGLAIDLGTTTIVMVLINLKTGTVIKEFAELNSLRKYGHDILSRITYIFANEFIDIKQELLEQLEHMITYHIEKYRQKISTTVVAGNTIMLHILKGLDLKALVYAPYNNQLKDDIILEKNDLLNVSGELIIPRTFTTYIGNDITLGIVSSLDINKAKHSFYIDLGTNGEIVYIENGILYCASTAAGPALEGGGILFGTGAIPGAICHYDGVNIQTINNQTPCGICGSGIIDIISYGLRQGKIDETGFLKDSSLHIINDIYITQKDVRAIQLAKSAIITHIEMLAKVGYLSIDNFYIAGGFGKYIDISNSISINLLPPLAKEKFKNLGNGALKGAVMVLRNKETLQLHRLLLTKCQLVELVKNAEFINKFVDNINFTYKS